MESKKADLRPEEKTVLKLRGLYEQYGYRKYKMGKFEEYSLYADNKDFIAGEKVITFTDLDGRLMALKPDVTLSIIKDSKLKDGDSDKLYYVENVYRESKESNNYKEINQMGLEYLGNVDDYAVAEVTGLALEALEAVSTDCILEISHMDYVVGLIKGLQVREYIKLKLLRLIRQKNTDGIRKTAARENVTEKELDALCAIPGLYGEMSETVKKAKGYVLNDDMAGALSHMEKIYGIMGAAGKAKHVQADLSIVNDIDYYNGIIFRGYVKELPGTVLAGGQYDKGLEKMEKKGGAAGFALYLNDLDRIAKAEKEYDIDVLLLYDKDQDPEDVAKAVETFREKGLSTRAALMKPESLRAKKIYKVKGKETVKEGKDA